MLLALKSLDPFATCLVHGGWFSRLSFCVIRLRADMSLLVRFRGFLCLLRRKNETTVQERMGMCNLALGALRSIGFRVSGSHAILLAVT